MCDISIMKAGEKGLVIFFDNAIEPAVNDCIRRVARAIATTMYRDLIEVIPSYRTLTVYFDPLKVSADDISQRIDHFLNTAAEGCANRKRQYASATAA